MRYSVEVHFENQSVLRFVEEIAIDVGYWISKCLEKTFFLCKDDVNGKWIVCNTKFITGILVDEYSEEASSLESYRTDKAEGF